MVVSKHFALLLLLAMALNLIASGVHAQNKVYYTGNTSAEQVLYGLLELSDGTFVLGGAATDLNWLPPETPTTQIQPTAANGSSIRQMGVSSGQTAFLLHLDTDGITPLRVVHFPHDQVHEIRWIKTNTPPGAMETGDLFISGMAGTASGGSNAGGYYIARLNANFVEGVPTELDYVWNIRTNGTNNQHASIQPWDVFSDGRVICQLYGAYASNWGEILVLPANPGPMSPASVDLPKTVMPGFRLHRVGLADGGTEVRYGSDLELAPGESIMESFMNTKTQHTDHSGLQRSFTSQDYHHWEKDENGFWRKGKYPLDAFWNNYWFRPQHPDGHNNMWGGDARGYTGYKLAGTGNAEGSPYTPRVGAITVDKRNDHFYIGLNWASRLPGTNNPDFEPAFIAFDQTGKMKWWARLYQEYNDTSEEGPENIFGEVTAIPAPNQIRVAALQGIELNIARKTSGSDGYIHGYRRLYWDEAAEKGLKFSEIEAYDATTGTLTFTGEIDPLITVGHGVMVDGTEMTRTHTSTPDQYIDAIAVDYSIPLDGDGYQGVIYVGARSHGNNVVNFWRGNQIRYQGEGGSGYLNAFTGSHGNIHLSWLGKYRDEGTRSTILAATFVGELFAINAFGDGSGLAGGYDDPNMDFWPNQNSGWPDRNTTSIGSQMMVNQNGELVIHGRGRTVHTTANAYQRNIRPYLGGSVTAAASSEELTAENLMGADLFLQNARIRINVGSGNEIRQIVDFDNETGTLVLAEPLSNIPNSGTSFRIDEGVGNWGNFVRVYSADLRTLRYSTLLSSAVNPVDGAGTNANSRIGTVWPLADGRIIVTGYHEDGEGLPIPTSAIPSWGSPEPLGNTGFIAILDPQANELPPLSGYEQWAQSAGVIGGMEANFKGMSNLLAYGMDIKDGPNRHALMPVIQATNDSMQILFQRHQEAEGLDWIVEVSEDLVDWTTHWQYSVDGETVGGAVVEAVKQGVLTYLTIAHPKHTPGTAEPAPRFFLRLRIQAD